MDEAQKPDDICHEINFIPRDYQVELFHAALEENIIVYLPTGSGKTFIAALLIKEMSADVIRKLENGGKRTIFLVPTVVLAIQQASYLRRHTNLHVTEYYGSMGVDLWKKERWQAEFEKAHVLVMTAQIFVDILNHAFFKTNQINLLILDECHAAVKDAPMKQVLSKIAKCPVAERPKILGLTATLFRKRCQPQQVHSVIQELSESMNCTVKLPKHSATVHSNSTKPCEMIFQYDDSIAGQNEDAKQLTDVISARVSLLKQEFYQRYDFKSGSADKIKILKDVLEDFLYLLGAFGPYGAYRCALVYLRVLQKVKVQAKAQQFGHDVDKLSKLCEEIRDGCTQSFGKYSLLNRLLLFVQPRVLRLLEILRNLSPEDATTGGSASLPKISGIIFVERRCMANVLYHFLKEILQYDSKLKFLKPLFTMGQAASRNFTAKDSYLFNLKQKDVIREFREGRCNMIVATSVLEEGIDIPTCNLVIRFDKVNTYCDYIQTKGRARSMKALYCLLVSSSDTDSYLQDLMNLHAIEQQLMSVADFDDDVDNLVDGMCSHIIEPYAPFGESGPRVTMQSAVSLVNRYCGQLCSNGGVVLAPKWTMSLGDETQADPAWMQKIYSALRNAPTMADGTRFKFNGKLFQCRLFLPLNSPLREEVVGDIMPSKRLAKQAVALKTCIKLHELKELDDVHLFPVKVKLQNDLDAFLEEKYMEVEGPGAPGGEKKDIFERHIPACFSDCRPLAGEQCYVYAIKFTVVKPCKDPKNQYLPFTVDTQLAILTSRTIPTVCSFPLVTKAGEIQVEISGVDCVVLDEDQLETMRRFHRFLFYDVIYLRRIELEFDPEFASVQFLVVPVERETGRLDFRFADRMVSAPYVDWEKKPDEVFHFDAAAYGDAVVLPWYRPLGVVNAFYVDSVTELTPLSCFPEKPFTNYADYFQKKYKLTVTETEQRLLSVSREVSGKNFLLYRVFPQKTKERPVHLMPEFCYVHPMPCSVWKQAAWIPAVIHRLTGMLVAEELRVRISRETNIGVEFLPISAHVESVWRPLQMRQSRSSDSETAFASVDPRLLLHSTNLPVEIGGPDLLDREIDLVWYVECSESDLLSSSDADCEPMELSTDDCGPNNCSIEDNPPDRMSQAPSLREGTLNLCFDAPAPSDLSLYGPSPGLVLEALTLARSRDGYDLERLETIGDSILKLAVTIYAYGQTAAWQCDEGRLSQMRMQQICNKRLYHAGVAKGVGQLIAGQAFDLMCGFLPPAFKTPEPSVSGEMNNRIYQSVSSKNIADSIEALIGVYLLSTGIKGSLILMNWLGLKTTPSTTSQVNDINGFPLLLPSIPPPVSGSDEERAIKHLYDVYGLESFERRLCYTFKNKSLLIEALTHASYYLNRVTGCYQRLEFIGDAVLDFLVTRYYYDDARQHSPGMLTDLRSAIVNNETFAVMAVRNRFHLYLKHLSLSLSVTLDKFIQAQEANGHMLMHDYFVLEETADSNERLASNVDVPKVLGDIFESVAGAIFIDSGMSLDTVWKSYFPFLQNEIEKFNHDVPYSALRVLNESNSKGNIKFKKAEELSDGRFCVAFEIDGNRVFKGVGGSTKTAKAAAAKYALSVLKKEKPSALLKSA